MVHRATDGACRIHHRMVRRPVPCQPVTLGQACALAGRLGLGPMDPTSPLLYLDGPAVRAALPPVPERLALAERALVALAGEAQLPAKIGVHPRPAASWAHAMPAWVPGDAEDGSRDLLGVKFVSGFPDNAGLGLPALHATLLLCDPRTG